jgi:hypothetical protein
MPVSSFGAENGLLKINMKCIRLERRSLELTWDSEKKVMPCSIQLITYLPTYPPTHPPTQSPSWEVNSHSASQKITHFYGTRRFIAVFTRARHWFLSWARWIQSTPAHPISLRHILILSSHLRLGFTSCLLPLGFPTETLYEFHIP